MQETNGLLGPDRFRNWLQFIIHIDRINALIEQAQEVGDRRTGGQRLAVAPHDILEDPLANPGGPIRRLALVRTASSGLSRLQEFFTDILEPTETTTRCPYKGKATYWSARIGERVFKDIVWSYQEPLPACSPIARFL